MQQCPGRRSLTTRTARRRSAREPTASVRQPAPGLSLSHRPGLAFTAATRALAAAMISVPFALVSHGALADEGGSSYWTPGSYASLAATPSEPGFSLTSIYYHPSVFNSVEVARANRIRIGRHSDPLISEEFANSHTIKDLAMVTPTYTFATPVLGGQANVSLTTTYGRNNNDPERASSRFTFDWTVRSHALPFRDDRQLGDRFRRFGSAGLAAVDRWCP